MRGVRAYSLGNLSRRSEAVGLGEQVMKIRGKSHSLSFHKACRPAGRTDKRTDNFHGKIHPA